MQRLCMKRDAVIVFSKTRQKWRYTLTLKALLLSNNEKFPEVQMLPKVGFDPTTCGLSPHISSELVIYYL